MEKEESPVRSVEHDVPFKREVSNRLSEITLAYNTSIHSQLQRLYDAVVQQIRATHAHRSVYQTWTT